jgi:hypothetical protein
MTVWAKHWDMTILEYGAEPLRKVFIWNAFLSFMVLCKHTFVYASAMHNTLQEITKKTDWGFTIRQTVKTDSGCPHMFKVVTWMSEV